MNSYKFSLLTSLLISSTTYAQENIKPLPANILFTAPIDFEQKDVQLPVNLEENLSNTQNPTTAIAAINHIDEKITQAMLKQDWHHLQTLLEHYPQQAKYDRILYLYAQGALYRANKNYKAAIANYEQIMHIQPNLAYPRFDLAIMLFENKQYQQAEQHFKQAMPHLLPNMQHIAQQYLKNIQQQQAWHPHIDLQYEQTDNVNNAANSLFININGATFKRDRTSLPQSAQGIRYATGIDKKYNLYGNHYIQADAAFRGVNYWDNQAYSEQSLHLNLAYLYQDYQHTWQISPFTTFNRLGGEMYNQQYGVMLQFNKKYSPKWQTLSNIGYTKKHYRENLLVQRYDGHLYQTSHYVYWQAKPTFLLFTGIDARYDDVKDPSESSVRYGANIGTIVSKYQMNVRLNAYYALRKFRENHYLYDVKRKDHEYQFATSVWHNRLQWRNFVPKLNYRYSKIESNLSDMYSRSGGEWFMSVERNF